jgi:hypothetical protein
MQIKHWLTALVAFVSALPTVTQAATTDPYQLIYRASGVADDGTASGVNTIVVCTNYSTVTENVAIIFRTETGASAYYSPAPVASAASIVVSTHASFVYSTAINAATGNIGGGYLSVGSTTTSLVCSAMIGLLNSVQPNSTTSLHMQRFNPEANSVE